MANKQDKFVSFDNNQFSMDVDIPEKPVSEPVQADTPADSYVPGQAYREAQEKKAARKAAKKSAKSNGPSGSNGGDLPPVKKEPSYVTKQFMIICLVIAIILSSALGAGIALAVGGSVKSDTPSKPSENLSDSSLSDATGSDLTISQIVAKNQDAVVEIVVSGTTTGMFGQMQLTEGAGSGVILTKDGYIVTNYHVIEGANKVQVTLHNEDSYSATVVAGDEENDIAVIKINANGLTCATIGDSSTASVGDLVVAIGNPLGQLGGTCTSGIISALDRRLTIDGTTLNLMQTDAAINAGNSGGGLFNGEGDLIGIVDAKSSGTGIEGLAFAIPINAVKEELDEIISTGKVSGKPAIGITIYDVSETNAQYYNLGEPGVYIAEVTGDNAQKAGFQTGDRIISIDDKDIESSSDFIQRVRSHKAGDTVTVVVVRDGQEISIKTVLEELVSVDNAE